MDRGRMLRIEIDDEDTDRHAALAIEDDPLSIGSP